MDQAATDHYRHCAPAQGGVSAFDRDACDGPVLATIFRECYGRWGGRRTLIVPAKPEGIDEQYVDWLWYYDPDIIYSFVALSEEAIARIHEKYCPTHLKINSSAARPEQAAELGRVELPIQGLSSLSLITTLLNRRNMLTQKISDLKIIDKYYDGSESQFLEENFGFVLSSCQTNVSRLYPELFSSLALISENRLPTLMWEKMRRPNMSPRKSRCLRNSPKIVLFGGSR